ncbi:MAG: cupin domain-containing protein [Pseudomonadota bacterium]
MNRVKAKPTVQVDNERTTVTEWRFPVGAETGWHRHEYDYIVVPGRDGELLIEGDDGVERISELAAGVSYFRNAGVEHNVVNNNNFEFSFVEIEIK